jgi:ABC-type transport system substrate-binding protein
MSYAINYSFIIEVLREGQALRANSPISPGFGIPYNKSAKAPDFNITKAREIMVSMGFGDMEWTDQQWINKTEYYPGFRFVSYFYNTGNSFREQLFLSLHETFKLIGIDLEEKTPGWDPLWYYWPEYEDLDMFAIGWSPDYLDPYKMLDFLFNPNSSSNAALVNDSKLNAMMALALETTDDEARNTIYKNIQGYMTEACFHVPLYHSKVISVHSADIHGVPYNAIGALQLFEMWRS